MATVTLRLDDATRDEVEAYAREQERSVSEVLRGAIDAMLGREVEMTRTDVPQSINMVDRRVLSLLHNILERLPSEDEAVDYHRQATEALNGGYSGEYPDEFAAIQPEMPRAECGLVWDILDMFRVLHASVETVGKKAVEGFGDLADLALEFGGLDLSDAREGRMLLYARFLVETDRWTDLAKYFDRAHDRGNSHSPHLPSYERMLAVYEPIFRRRVRTRGVGDLFFSEAELRQVAAAWGHPRG